MLLNLLLTILTVTQDVRVSMLDGPTVSGSLMEMTTESLKLKSDSGETLVPLNAVMSLDAENAAVAESSGDAPPPQQVWLHDGSTLAGSAVSKSARQVTVVTAEFGELSIPAAGVRAVRLMPDDPVYSAQWATFLQRDSEKDLLIIPKRSGEGLDFLSGIVNAVTADEISFLLDGDNVPVPASRVYGVVFAKPAAKAGAAGVSIRTISGVSISARTVTSDGSMFRIETAWGQKVELPAERLQRIDFSSGRIRYLSDLPPIREEFLGVDPEGTLFAGLIDRKTAELMYRPRRDSTIDPSVPLRLRGQRFEKGLCIHSKTRIEWALDRRFASLNAIVGVDDEVAFNQVRQVALTVEGDGEVLFSRIFTTNEDPIPLKLSVESVSTLSILVDYADGDSSCDWLDLADAKLILVTESK
ncbi:MAG: NPCBM/NEW2 domain-containing protein [Planctomycetaceae bacterium]|nr:NPCBM/NEW2 domain-containing protein [Planctomycetaceae bacterium]